MTWLDVVNRNNLFRIFWMMVEIEKTCVTFLSLFDKFISCPTRERMQLPWLFQRLITGVTTDGFVVKGNGCGEGWQTGEMAAQVDFNVTRAEVADVAVTIRYQIRFTADGSQFRETTR